MATTLFLRDQVADITPGAEIAKLASTTRGAGSVTKATNTALGPTAGVQCTNGAGGTAITWLTVPLAAVTIAGSITANIRGLESSLSANTGLQVKVERCNTAGSVLSQIANAEFGTELGTVDAAQNWAITPTSTTLVNGDRLKITVLGNDAGGTMAATFTFTISYDGATGAAAGDTFLTFTEALTVFAPSAGSYSDPDLVLGSVDGYSNAAATASLFLAEQVFAYPARVGGVQVHATTAGSGTGSTTVDVLLNGTSIYHQTSDRPTLAAASTGAFAQANPPTTRAIKRGDILAIQVAAIPATTGHARLKAHVAIERALQRGA